MIIDPDAVIRRLNAIHPGFIERGAVLRALIQAICLELDIALVAALESIDPQKLERAGVALAHFALLRESEGK